MGIFFNSFQRQTAALRIALIGRKMTSLSVVENVAIEPQVGRVVEEVRSYGREIEIIWDDGVVLRTKLRLNGSWKIISITDQPRKIRGTAQVIIQVEGLVATCVGAAQIETHHDFDPRRHPILGRQGPDMADPKTDIEDCVDLMINYENADETVAEVLLDQRVIRGIGNVFRCELLWTCEMHPWAKISSLNRAECRELISIAVEMLQTGSHFQSSSLAVYGKHGKSCERCNGLVRVTHHGEANRVLYWCADCQTRHSGASSSRYVTEHDTPPGMHPAEFIYLSEIDKARKLG